MHTLKLTTVVDVEIKILKVSAGVRYWEDATVDGKEDTDGTLIPCRNVDRWEPVIDLETGVIQNWEKGKTADIHYKICDDGTYTLLSFGDEPVCEINDYVPKIMSPGGQGYGDYIIMKIDENGKIENWKVILSEFEEEKE